MRKVVAAKLHGLRVTGADLNYHGSITLDPEHCERAGVLPLEFVEIWNKSSGARISTYVIFGERGSRCCVLNGAAARTCQVGDEIIVASSAYVQENEIAGVRPRVLTFDAANDVTSVLTYAVERTPDGRFSFAILDEAGQALKVPVRSK